MRKLDTSLISDTLGMPVKAGVLEHLQFAYQEALTALATNIVGDGFSTTTGYALYGAVNGGIGTNFNINAGAIFYEGEVYLVDAQFFTIAGGQVAVASIALTQYTSGDRADPVQFTDGVNRNVLNIRKIVFASGASGSGLFDYNNIIPTRIDFANAQVTGGIPASVTIKFDRDQAIYYAGTGTVDTTIIFDMTNARPGTVVRIKWAWGAGRTLTVTAGTGNDAYLEGGDLTRVSSRTNAMYFTFLGLNEAGHHEIGYSISQIV